MKNLVRFIVLTLVLTACGDGRLSPQGGTITSVQGGSGLTGGGTGGAVTLNVGATAGGGLTVGADSIGLSTACASGEVLQWDGDSWECEVAGITMSVGANIIPKSDGANLVASSWTDDGTNTTTTANIIGTNAVFGSSTTTTAKVYSVVTGSGTGLRADNTSSGKTSDSYGVRSVQTGSFDSTADTRRNYSVSAQAAASRSAGSNDVINFGVYTTASGGQANYSIYGDAGTVALNVSSGNTCIGATSCSEKLSVTGTASVTSTVGNTFTSTYSGTGITANRNAITGTTSGATFDTTAASRTARAGLFQAFATRSTGSNDLINVGIEAAAANGQDNRAIWATSGNVLLNTTSGNTCIGATSCSSKLSVTGNTSISGNTTIGGTLTVGGNATWGDSFTDAHALVGTLDANGTAGTNGQVLKIVSGLPQWSDAGGITNSAGANVIPKSDGTNLVASSWTDDGTNTTTTANIIGTNAAFGSSTTNLAKVYAVVNGGGVNFRAENTTTGKTSGATGFRAEMLGSFDATAADRDNIAMIANAAASRSAGSNNVTNVGLHADVNGGQINIAIRTLRGDVYLNNTSGNTGIGTAPSSLQKVTIASSQHGIVSTATAASAGSGKIGVQGISTGTYDLTSGTATAFGVYGAATGTRSAGGNSLVNVGLYGAASGGQENRGLWVDSGTAVFDDNATIGGTLGVTGASTLTGGFTAGAASIIRDGTPTTAQPHPSDSLLGIEDADGSVVQMSLRGTGTKSIAFANANSSADGFLNYTTSRSMSFGVTGSSRMLLDASGTLWLGDSGGQAVNNNVNVLNIGNTGTGQTASASLINATHTGSFNTTSSGLVSVGVLVDIASTRSTGSNSLTNKAISASASGAQFNIALETGDGDVWLNRNGGSFRTDATHQRGIRNHAEDLYLEWNDDWLTTLPQTGAGGTSTELVGTGVEYLSVAIGASTTSATISGLSHTTAESGHPGVVRFDTGSTTNGNLYRITDRTLEVSATDTKHVYEAIVRFPVLSSGSDTYVAGVGFLSDPTDPVKSANGCWISYDQPNTGGFNSGNQNKFVCICRNADVTPTYTGYRMDGTTVSDNSFTTVDAPVAADTWYKLRVEVTDSLAEFYVDDVKSCEIDSNFPITQFSAAGWALKKTGGSTAVQMDVDYTGLSVLLGDHR